MLQVVQSYKTGEVSVFDVPVPHCGSGGILVRNRRSLISLGTERSTIELGKKSLIGKARARPDLVKRVIEKAKRDGLRRTYEEAMGRLDAPTPLGYSCAGEVIEVGAAAHEFQPGDRVACIGQGFASHAELVSVPVNLATKIPDGVSYEEASFGMLGIIAFHGVRCAKLEFGATVAVIGLGLLGILAVQLLHAYGCRVVCMDPAEDKVALAAKHGVFAAVSSNEALEDAALAVSSGFGVDAVIITAATKSDEPVNVAVRLCRQRGRIVVVGVADIHPNRNELWHKELELIVSRAAGPGSLDPLYELGGIDLPIGDVRWTQNRNLAEFLRLIADERIDVASLISHRFAIAQAGNAYVQLLDGSLSSAIGVELTYPENTEIRRRLPVPSATPAAKPGDLRIAVIGAGLFGKAVLLPALEKVKGVSLQVLTASTGASAMHNAKRFGFKEAATDASDVMDSPDVDAVIAATPHDQHAALVLKAISAKKPLFLEKPLCVTPEELDGISRALSQASVAPVLMIGHNRRYSPHIDKLRGWLADRKAPLVLDMRINAGFVPPEHWVHSEAQGRSRIVGEMTHFLDLICVLTGARFEKVQAMRTSGDDRTVVNNDNLSAVFEMTDGSVATLVYSAQGARQTPREQIDIFTGGTTITSEDFKMSARYTASRKEVFKTSGAQSGYVQELQRFVNVIRGKSNLSPSIDEALHVMRTAFAVEEALAEGKPVLIA